MREKCFWWIVHFVGLGGGDPLRWIGFGKMFADTSGGENWPCGEETSSDGGGPGRHDGAEGFSMEVFHNV